MRKDKKAHRPKLANWLLHQYCKPRLLEDLEGDLNEYFERNVYSKGAFMARLIYFLDVVKFCRLYTIKKPGLMKVTGQIKLYQNYYKTSLRTIQHNKLFSAINVVGLSISMCVGLLLIAFYLEMASFDNFHLNAERIFRVNSVLHEAGGNSYNYASTSVLTNSKVKENVRGVEDIVNVHKGFNKDITYENKTIPLHGFWADKDFFKIFSFEVASGNRLTALENPNSIVLTESSALRIFNTTDVVGKFVRADTANFVVTAIIKDIPLNSHIHFDMLGSYITLDNYMSTHSSEWSRWDNMWDHYVYVMLSERRDYNDIQKELDRISTVENRNIHNRSIDLYPEPLRQIALTRNMSNSIGPTEDRSTFTLLGIFVVIVILSACFNYTNLSIARALRRVREVGIRKSIGASRGQVFRQFICESLMLSAFALALAFIFFLFIRKEFISMDIKYQEMLTLEPTPEMIAWFLMLAIGTGVLAGFIPAAFFAKLSPAIVLKDTSGLTLFRHINFRKVLIVFQYTLSILFIVVVSIGFRQYRYSLSFDLGFRTDNILTIDLQGNRATQIMQEISAIPEVKEIACAGFVSSVGVRQSAPLKYHDPKDSVWLNYNFIDESYIPMHKHRLLAGSNFSSQGSTQVAKSQLIVNKHTLTWMNIEDPRDAIGEEVTLEGINYSIIGVIEDFHYERINYPIENFGFRYDPAKFQVLNVKVESPDILATLGKVEAAWKKIDPIHPLEAKFYHEQIENAYEKLSWIVRLVAFIAFLAISIASLGLLGMVVFATETRTKEISVRKILGASFINLITLMSRSFIWLLITSAAIAIPGGYYLMDKVIFGSLVYRAPLGVLDVGLGALVVIVIALLTIVWQTSKVVRTNPASVLKNE